MTCTLYSLAMRPVKAVVTQLPHTNESQNLYSHQPCLQLYILRRPILNQVSSWFSLDADCITKHKVIRGRLSIQPSDGSLFQVEAPTEWQHHSIPPTSAQHGSPKWWWFTNKRPMGCPRGVFCGQSIIKHLWRHHKQPALTQTPDLPTTESSKISSWPEETATGT